jgi:hypothetical protein
MDIVTLSIGFIAGMILMAAIFFVGSTYLIDKKKLSVTKNVTTAALVALLVGVFAFSQVVVSYAQTAVPLEIPTDVIFTQTNSWMETFAPIAAIGIGISIALAVLGYLGKMIKSAFN